MIYSQSNISNSLLRDNNGQLYSKDAAEQKARDYIIQNFFQKTIKISNGNYTEDDKSEVLSFLQNIETYLNEKGEFTKFMDNIKEKKEFTIDECKQLIEFGNLINTNMNPELKHIFKDTFEKNTSEINKKLKEIQKSEENKNSKIKNSEIKNSEKPKKPKNPWRGGGSKKNKKHTQYGGEFFGIPSFFGLDEYYKSPIINTSNLFFDLRHPIPTNWNYVGDLRSKVGEKKKSPVLMQIPLDTIIAFVALLVLGIIPSSMNLVIHLATVSLSAIEMSIVLPLEIVDHTLGATKLIYDLIHKLTTRNDKIVPANNYDNSGKLPPLHTDFTSAIPRKYDYIDEESKIGRGGSKKRKKKTKKRKYKRQY